MTALLYLSVALVLLLPGLASEHANYGRYNFEIDPSLTQSWIMVMGVTGTGKSSFIKRALGNLDSSALGKICHGLEPCTQSVIISPWNYEGVNLFFVDTPGFEDPHRPYFEILNEIGETVSELYRSGIAIGAVIQLQRITDDRITRGTLQSMSALKDIVGIEKCPSLVLVTTRWENAERHVAVKREVEFKKAAYWGSMISAGAKVMRHDGSIESAQRILDKAISLCTETPLKIQAEMVTHGKSIEETSAMLAIEFFDVFEKMQNSYAKGEISWQDYMHSINDFVELQRKKSGVSWWSYAPKVADVLMTVARTVLYGAGWEGAVLIAITESVFQYIEGQPGHGSDQDQSGSKVSVIFPPKF